MNLQQILHSIQEAEKGLTKLVEQEQTTSKMILYIFVYEQTFIDEPGWGPNCQHIYAHDIEQAFQIFGHVIKVQKLTVRNINYGSQNEMAKEIDKINAYWNKYNKEHAK